MINGLISIHIVENSQVNMELVYSLDKHFAILVFTGCNFGQNQNVKAKMFQCLQILQPYHLKFILENALVQ